MVINQEPHYEDLCVAVEQLGGTIRLAREGAQWGFVVTSPSSSGGVRAIGFMLGDLTELDPAADLALCWLARFADE